MTESGLAKKMRWEADQTAIIPNAPDGYLKGLGPLPPRVKGSRKPDEPAAWIQIYVRSKAELDALFPTVLRILKPESLLWIAFPKDSSKTQTDLTRDKGWDVGQTSGLKWITLVSINETWSAFAVRPYKPGEPKQSFR